MLVKFLFLVNEFIHEIIQFMNEYDEIEIDTEKRFIEIYENEVELKITYLLQSEIDQI